MLTRFHQVLIGLLVVQIALVVIVMTRGGDAVVKEQPLLPGFDAAKVTHLKVFGDKGAFVDLDKRGTGWVLASSFDYPVETAKLNELLTPVAKMAAAEPLTTQKARHKQLRVAEDDFASKLVITVDGKDITLFVGGTAGERRTAVRLGADERVYGVDFNVTSVGTDPRSWVDPKYSVIPAEEIAKITIARPPSAGNSVTTVELVRGGGGGAGSGSGSAAAPAGWHVVLDGAPIALAPGETIDAEAIERIITSVATIEGGPADPKRDASSPAFTITIERAAGVPPAVIDVIVDADADWVHLRGSLKAAAVDKTRLADVVGANRTKLVKQPPPPPAGSGSAGSGSGGPR